MMWSEFNHGGRMKKQHLRRVKEVLTSAGFKNESLEELKRGPARELSQGDYIFFERFRKPVRRDTCPPLEQMSADDLFALESFYSAQIGH